MNDSIEACRRKIPWCPIERDVVIDWHKIETENAEWIEPMRQTPQDAIWHGEGDVWTHTRMVCESLVASEDWKTCNPYDRFVLFMAALLHDVGKPHCTKTEGGRIVAPKHAHHGTKFARRFLYETLGMTGECFDARESIVSLIRRHTLPYNIQNREDAVREVVTISTISSCWLLAILSEADIRGRIFENQNQSLESVKMFCQFADEQGCLTQPYPFASNHSRHAYFSGMLKHPSETLYDDTWGEVVLMSGLPASGKDTYIERHFADRPVISLDALRRQMNVSWDCDQTPVIEAARKKARQFLRSKTPFVWNAMNLRAYFRRSTIRLCCDYKASVRIVYLESDLSTLLQRNCSRMHPVPEITYHSLLNKWEIPTILEAHEWECEQCINLDS